MVASTIDSVWSQFPAIFTCGRHSFDCSDPDAVIHTLGVISEAGARLGEGIPGYTTEKGLILAYSKDCAEGTERLRQVLQSQTMDPQSSVPLTVQRSENGREFAGVFDAQAAACGFVVQIAKRIAH
jgi:hypothetical protein